MRRDEALRILSAHREELMTRGVETLSLFGSVGRDEGGPDSDVDLLVTFNRPTGLFGLVALQRYLEGRLGRPVDLTTPRGLRQQLRDQVLAEAVRAF